VEAIAYSVRRSPRARRPRLEIGRTGLELVVPTQMRLAEALPLVEEKRPWIERTLRRVDAAAAAIGVARLEDGGAIPYLGRELALRVELEPQRLRPRVTADDAGLHVRLARADDLRCALETWFRASARVEIGSRLDAATARAGSQYSRLTIRGQRTRWASCSQSGGMSFNWRLLLAPATILDYVVEHEVAHLEIADHSQRFWRLVAQRCPDYRERASWLRRHGTALWL